MQCGFIDMAYISLIWDADRGTPGFSGFKGGGVGNREMLGTEATGGIGYH